MPQEELLNKKTIYTLGAASALCWGAASIFNNIFQNSPPFSPTLLVLILAMAVSIGAAKGQKKWREYSFYLTVLFNTILITISALGIHGLNQSVDSGKTEKKDSVNTSSLIPFIDRYPWLPPAKLVEEIAVKEEKIENITLQNEILDTHVAILNKNISTLQKEQVDTKKQNDRINQAIEQQKIGYDALARNDFKTAMLSFKKAEELYPALQNNFEIYTYLKKNEKNFQTNPDELKKTVNTKYPKVTIKPDITKEKTDTKEDIKTDNIRKEEMKKEIRPK